MVCVDEQLERLRTKFPDIKAVGKDGVLSVLPEHGGFTLCWMMPLPKGKFNMDEVMVAFDVPPGFPAARPSNFFTDPDLRLSYGGHIRNTSHGVHPHFGGARRTWSTTTFNCDVNVQIVHGHVQMWDPNRSSLFTYAMVMKHALQGDWLSRQRD